MTRKQAAEHAKALTLNDVARLAGDVVTAKLAIERLENTRDRKIDAARKDCAEKSDEHKASIKDNQRLIRAVADREKAARGLPVTWKFARAIVRLWRGQPQVKLRARLKEEEAVAALSRTTWGGAYLRVPDPVLDKQAILRDRDAIADKLDRLGIRIVQNDEFEVTAPPSQQPAAQEAA